MSEYRGRFSAFGSPRPSGSEKRKKRRNGIRSSGNPFPGGLRSPARHVLLHRATGASVREDKERASKKIKKGREERA
ncbi:hypothetical protein AKJ61_04415 [candidate division MSBL1 archaeon SCGC-AAA259B11]|uniref:Uncharacterized protein n=1 Tax=candidate division MSBL1 archaeon SCGC-AAA259B11 TaxID=1698260 RepID=A0A133U3C1_9EURY|nr:hypothetical protein AKJ61_04415 [candidate division MSBL1 archaeon SCGC-AAA259B11]